MGWIYFCVEHGWLFTTVLIVCFRIENAIMQMSDPDVISVERNQNRAEIMQPNCHGKTLRLLGVCIGAVLAEL